MNLARISAVGFVLGIGVAALSSPEEVLASHQTFMVSNPAWNTACTAPSGCGVNGKLFGINLDWEVTGRSNLVCSDYGPNYTDIPAAIRDAITSWEGLLPGTQFYPGCPGGRSATWFVREDFPCGQDVYACIFQYVDAFDVDRKAYYTGSTVIRISNIRVCTCEYSGMRYVAAHELGDVFGLDEAYLDGGTSNPISDYRCNGALYSVMDASPPRTSQYVTAPCDTYSPTSWDIDKARLLHQLNPMTQLLPTNHAPGVMSVRWWDPTWADSGYRFYAYRHEGNAWNYTGQTWLHIDKVGHAGVHNATYYIKGSQPSGTYRLCGYTYSGIHLNQHWVCAPSAYMP